MVFLGLIIAPIEKNAVGAKILNEGDGLWFAITTVTGVGYGIWCRLRTWEDSGGVS